MKEAISYTERSIQEAQGRGDTQINFIVGMSTTLFPRWSAEHYTPHRQRLAFTQRCQNQTRHRGAHAEVSSTIVLVFVFPWSTQYNRYNLVAEVDPSNAGVLIVSLDGQERGAGRVVQPDDLARGIEQPDEGCVVM